MQVGSSSVFQVLCLVMDWLLSVRQDRIALHPALHWAGLGEPVIHLASFLAAVDDDVIMSEASE
jgi:hypothetical protein